LRKNNGKTINGGIAGANGIFPAVNGAVEKRGSFEYLRGITQCPYRPPEKYFFLEAESNHSRAI
jgi:hypothetical protein